jgi:hypothetical protein
MSFSTELAKLVTDQLSRFVTLNRHQLAGQVANLDFWLGEVRHALGVIDGYGVRFVRMHGAQEAYAARHGTKEFVLDVDGYTPKVPPSPPRRIPDRELQKARKSLTEAVSRLLQRCQRDGLISEQQMSEASRGLGIE